MGVLLLMMGSIPSAAQSGHEIQPGYDEVYPVKYIEQGAPDSSEESCNALPNAVWVTTKWLNKGVFGESWDPVSECIRYFPSDDAIGAKSAVLFFGGDIVVLRGAGDSVNNPGYGANSYRQQIEKSNASARRIKVPFIHVARPGMYGSSGDTHIYRHSFKEAATMNAAVDAIKMKLGYERVSVVGQSGGGGVVAALLTSGRTDLDCVTMSSATASNKMRLKTSANTADVRAGQDTTGLPLRQVYDARDLLDAVRPDPGRRVFMLAAREDKAVSFVSQSEFAEAANAKGVPIKLMEARGFGSKRHSTQLAGVDVTALCMGGRSDEEIAQRVASDLH